MPKRRRRRAQSPNRKQGRIDAQATVAAAQGWSSLPSDLLNLVGDRLLATNDIDAYMDMRAVCQHWRRSATADPHADPRFRPTQWVMLDDVVKHYYSRDYGRDDSRLFVHTATGRFLRKRLPLLRDYDLVTSTAGGLLVLADRARAARPRTSVCVLNPFTGYLVRFAAPMPMPPRGPWRFAAAVVGSTCSPRLFLVSIVSDGGPNKVYWADPQSVSFSQEISHSRCPASCLPLLSAAKCAADVKRGVLLLGVSKHLDLLGANALFRCYTVEIPGGVGDMFAVVKRQDDMVVFKVDSAGNLTEKVRSIGNLALFLGVRCVAVDASMFPGIQANCAYFAMEMADTMELAIYKIDFGAEIVVQEPEFVEKAVPFDRPFNPWVSTRWCSNYWSFDSTPFTLTQILCNYTMDIPCDPPMWKLDSGRYGRRHSFDDMAPYIHHEHDDE